MSQSGQLTDASPRIAGFGEDQFARILLFVAPALFCTNLLVAKATADLIPPVHLSFLRWGATFLLLLPLVGPRLWVRGGAMLREWKDLAILGALGMGVCGAFVYIGADTTSATNIGLIYSASPVLIILLAAAFYGEAVSKLQIAGITLSLLGVIVIVCRADLDVLVNLAFTVGDLWILAAMIGWAVYSVLLRHRPSEMGLSTRFGATTLAGVIILAPFTLWEASTGNVPVWNWETAGWIALLALVASFGAYQVYAYVQRVLGAGRSSLLMYLVPIYNAVLAWALLGETPQPYHWIGAALVLPGMMLATAKGKKKTA
ncbi:MAG: DMT family transporter [Alphaproteobacteria bacterium]|nr:DMT family transporter [Alphaproteobacteria bacterium]MBO6864516.1 DMT family transporter [Alphaproteobacteria bacterium]